MNTVGKHFPRSGSVLLCISGLDDTENLEIYKTYMHFGRIADYGKKSIAGNRPNWVLIKSISLILPDYGFSDVKLNLI